jgi:ZIP family zinc transporter
VRRPLPLVLLLLALAGAAAALVVALTRPSSYTAPPGAAAEGELAVLHATLGPGRVLLAVRNRTEEAVRIAQVIVNDGFVDFRGGHASIAPGATGRVVVPYPWLAGESYEFELLASNGAAIDYELEDAGAG